MNNKITIALFLTISLTFIFCSNPQKSNNAVEENEIQLNFKNWQNDQIANGTYLDSIRCNITFFSDSDSEITDSLATVGFPDDSTIVYHYYYLNDDKILDAIIVYNLQSCDGAAALNYAQVELVVLSTTDSKYVVKEEYFRSIENEIGDGNLYIDSIQNKKVYGTYREYRDDDPRCCPSYNKMVEIELMTKKYSVK